MSYKKNIVLIGFMGCGKTTLGSRLAYKLKYSFVDSDRRIEDEKKMSISEMFEKYGEEYFRQTEKDMIKRLSKVDKQVIATGGGVIKNPENVEELKKKGIIVYLSATPEHIYSNLRNDNSRPLLQGGDKLQIITELLEQREGLYKECADIIIDVNSSAINDTVDYMIQKLGGLI